MPIQKYMCSPMYPWCMLLLLGLMYCLSTASTFASLGIVLPSMIYEFNWSWAEAGFGFTILGLTCGLSSYLPAVMIRKLGIRLTLFFGFIIFIFGCYYLYSTTSLCNYFVGSAILGIGFTFLATIPGTYVLSRLFEKQSLAFGCYFTIGGLGGIVGPWIYILATRVWGSWRIHWVISALCLAIVVFITLFTLREGQCEIVYAKTITDKLTQYSSEKIYKTKEIWTANSALCTWQFYIIAASYTAFLWCGITVNSFAIAHIMAQGFNETIAAGSLSAMAFINACSRLVGGAIGEKIEPKKLLIGGLVIIIFGLISLSITTTWVWLILFPIFVGIGYGMTFLTSSVLLVNYFGRGPYVELFSVTNLLSTCACFAPFLCGMIKDHTSSFTPAFLIISIPVCIILSLALLMKPPVQRVV